MPFCFYIPFCCIYQSGVAGKKKILLFSFNTVKKIEQEIFMGFIIVMCVAIWGLKIIFSGD
jgi:hypothetical protein